jgi:hypothetical protein
LDIEKRLSFFHTKKQEETFLLYSLFYLGRRIKVSFLFFLWKNESLFLIFLWKNESLFLVFWGGRNPNKTRNKLSFFHKENQGRDSFFHKKTKKLLFFYPNKTRNKLSFFQKK